MTPDERATEATQKARRRRPGSIAVAAYVVATILAASYLAESLRFHVGTLMAPGEGFFPVLASSIVLLGLATVPIRRRHPEERDERSPTPVGVPPMLSGTIPMDTDSALAPLAEPAVNDPDDDPDPSLGPLGWLKVGIVWAAAAAFVALSGRLVRVPVFGPYAGLGALALVVVVVMRGRWYLALATAVGTMVGGYLLFDQVLHVPLGRGSGLSW